MEVNKDCRIPKIILSNKKLTANAKLLYAVIDSVSESGRCYKSNNWFSEIFNVNKQTISNWVSKLNKEGFIDVSVITLLDDMGIPVTYRRVIYLKEEISKS